MPANAWELRADVGPLETAALRWEEISMLMTRRGDEIVTAALSPIVHWMKKPMRMAEPPYQSDDARIAQSDHSDAPGRKCPQAATPARARLPSPSQTTRSPPIHRPARPSVPGRSPGW